MEDSDRYFRIAVRPVEAIPKQLLLTTLVHTWDKWANCERTFTYAIVEIKAKGLHEAYAKLRVQYMVEGWASDLCEKIEDDGRQITLSSFLHYG